MKIKDIFKIAIVVLKAAADIYDSYNKKGKK